MSGAQEDARGASDRSESSRSEMSGSAGDMVQARDVSGGVHFHRSGSTPGPIPRQLPGDVRGFVNRVVELGRLDEVLAAEDPHSMVLSIIVGTAGVGKTSLAVHWAHRVRDRFPDGQLYVNLRGYDPGEPVTPDEALDRFLRALDVTPNAIPVEVQAKESLYRSLVADRRMLIILDNASSVRQVRPLLPGTASCVVLVTSRSRLSGLVARDGAQRVTIDTLTSSEAVSLLRLVAGTYRDNDDPEELAELARLCASLPLALRIAAERAASRPLMPLRDLIRDLRDESGLWDALSADDDEEADAVRTVFAWSYRALPPNAARLFHMLGLHPGAHFDARAAAALFGSSEREARRLLDVLIGAHLVEQPTPERYQFHDLLRAYSADQARHLESPQDQDAALTRLFDWYLHTAHSVAGILHIHWVTLELPSPAAGVTPFIITDYAEAQRWYENERANLVAIVRAAAELHMDRVAWQLPVVMREVYSYRNPFEDWFTTTRIGLDAVRREGNRFGEALLLESLGWASRQTQRYQESIDFHSRALAIWQERGDRAGQALAITRLGLAHTDMRHLDTAREQYLLALEICNEIGHERGRAILTTNLGWLYEHQGDFQQSIELSRQGAADMRALGDKLYEADALNQVARAYCGLEQWEEAVTHAEDALRIDQEEGHLTFEGFHLATYGAALRGSGRYGDSLTAYQRCAVIHRRLGDRAREGQALDGAGETYREMGHFDEAADFHRQAAAILRTVGDRWLLAVALDNLATTLNVAGHGDDAKTHWREVLPLVVEYSDPVAAKLRERARQYLADGQPR